MKAKFLNKTTIVDLETAQNSMFYIDEKRVLTQNGTVAFRCGTIEGLITAEAVNALKSGKESSVEVAKIIYGDDGESCNLAYVRKDNFAATASTKAAEHGYARAQFNLGVCFEFGKGVEKDMEKAVFWYTKAAEQGYANAQFNLGVCYENGKGVEKDMEKAVFWYTKAAEQGYANAQGRLGTCYLNGVGIQKNYSEAFKWYMKSAEQGYVKAIYAVGLCYSNGYGVMQNNDEAKKWYEKAEENGHIGAKKALEKMELNELVRFFKDKGFTKSHEISQYIVKKNLGYRFRHISGYVKLEKDNEKWEFKGGIDPKYYAEICRLLEIGNKETKSEVTGFDSFDERDF